MRIFSFGGGVQSMAALVLAKQGKIDFRAFVFSNVGADSENPDTISYFGSVALPFAQANHLELHEIKRTTNSEETLYHRLLRENNSIVIPVHMPSGAPGTRNCTKSFKIAVIRKWLGKGSHVVGLGISLDEFQRMRNDSGYKNIVNEYPLIDLKLTRSACIDIIKSEGLPVPPKSSCWFCPFHNMAAWQEIRRNKPELFQKAVELEALLNEKRAKLKRDKVWLTQKAKPLSQVVADQPLLFVEEEPCDSGYCMV